MPYFPRIMNAYVLDALTILIAVLASEFIIDAYRRHRKRAHMRNLNALSQRAKRFKRGVRDAACQPNC